MSKSACPVGTSRRATPQDIDRLEACRRAAIAACPGYDAAQRHVWLAAEPNWSTLVHDALLVQVDDHIVGFCVATPSELGYLYVHPNYQRQGIAHFLVSEVEQPGMRCDCNAFSARLIQSRGWEPVAPNRKARDGVVFENTWFEFTGGTQASR